MQKGNVAELLLYSLICLSIGTSKALGLFCFLSLSDILALPVIAKLAICFLMLKPEKSLLYRYRYRPKLRVN